MEDRAGETAAEAAAGATASAARKNLVVGLVRLAFGAAGLAAAIAEGARSASAFAEAAFGAGFLLFLLVSPGRRSPPLRAVLPTRERRWWQEVALALYPSSYGVGVLTAIALVLDRSSLAALLSGILLGMAAAALLAAATTRS